MPHTLLLADDSTTIQRVVSLMFSDEDISVVPVNSGDAAIEALGRIRPDVVLADVDMPGPDGYALAAIIRERRMAPPVPVLLMAGAFDTVDESRAAACGAVGVLTKPFDPPSMIARIKAVIAAAESGGSIAFTVEAPPTLAVDLGVGVLDGNAAAPAPGRSAGQASQMDAIPGTAATPAILEQASSAGFSDAQLSGPADVPALDRADLPLRDDQREASGEGMWPDAVPLNEPQRDVSEVDRYFEQLDAQFAALAQQPRPASAPPATVPSELPQEAPMLPAATVPESALVAPPEAIAPPEVPAVPPGPAASVPALPLTDAFQALLQAEQAGAALAAIRPTLAPPASAPVVDLDALAEQVATRVLARLSDRAIRETVAEVVAATAERVVREEIDRIKRNIT